MQNIQDIKSSKIAVHFVKLLTCYLYVDRLMKL